MIKAILADALGMHLDSFQRILVDPASVSVVRYTAPRPYVVDVNSTTADLAAIFRRSRKTAPAVPPPKTRRRPGRRRPGAAEPLA